MIKRPDENGNDDKILENDDEWSQSTICVQLTRLTCFLNQDENYYDTGSSVYSIERTLGSCTTTRNSKLLFCFFKFLGSTQ